MQLPFCFFLACAVLVGLLVETWFKRRQSWALPGAFLYVTVAAWYFADLFLNPDEYLSMPQEVLNLSYLQVTAFLIVYRLLVPWLSRRFSRNAGKILRQGKVPPPEVLFCGTVLVWLILACIGVFRMNGDVLGSLFPVDARAGATMWQRAAGNAAGESGFLVSAAGYTYQLVCASFGLYFFFLKRTPVRLAVIAMMLLTWPYFLLSGSRNFFLAVSLPFFFAYLLFARQAWPVKAVCLALAFLLVDAAFKVVIADRSVGFRSFITGDDRQDPKYAEARHLGLNMIQELCYTNIYARLRGPDYGSRYLNEVYSVIPRAIWPSKPLLGIDYSIWRGFEGGDSDIGVEATISSGMIGGGVLGFGPYAGPLVPALLMAIWTSLLARWWQQRASLLRTLLFLIGLGLTFNLGRDITSLVLWPIAFGCSFARLVELFCGSPAVSGPVPRVPRSLPAAARPSQPSQT